MNYIRNFEAKELLCNITKENNTVNVEMKEKYGIEEINDNHWSGTLPDSLLHDKLFATKKWKGSNVPHIVNVNFNKSICSYVTEAEEIKKDKVLMTKKEMREQLYTNGFDVEGVHFDLFMRSSAKAKTGSALFIDSKYYKRLKAWSWIDIDFDDGQEMDIASLSAYDSLILSSIKAYTTIQPNQILMIDDYVAKFKENRHSSITTKVIDKDGHETIATEEKVIELANTVWDGQSLADVSLFEEAGLSNKGSMVLRQRFFKTCCINTKISQFFLDNGITEVKDMFGNVMDATKIKLITTPSSLKLFKFAYKLSGKNLTYDYWLNSLHDNDFKFGVCKTESSSKFNEVNQLSYQIINSLPLTANDIKTLMSWEIEHVDKLKNNTPYLIEFANKFNTVTSSMWTRLYEANTDISFTHGFKDWRRKLIDGYLNKLRQGKIKIADTDYCVVFGNPYEMLRAGAGLSHDSSLHIGRQIYTPMFDDLVEVATFRNPHTSMGNVGNYVNKRHSQFRYFNLTDNIAIINNYDNDILDRHNSMDQDGDTMLCSTNSILVSKSKLCMSQFPTPIPMIDQTAKNRVYDAKNRSIVDNIISDNRIGEICNMGAVYQSYYWDEYFKDNPDTDKLDVIYDAISQLSSLSGLEIDKAKKLANVNMVSCLNRIRNLEYGNKKVIVRKPDSEGKDLMVKPMFFANVSKSACHNEPFNCPMDFVMNLIDAKDIFPSRKRTMNIDISLLLNEKTSKGDNKQIDKIKKIAKELNNEIISVKTTNNSKEYKETYIGIRRTRALQKITKLRVKESTMLEIFYRVYSCNSKDTDIKKYKATLLNLLSQCQPNFPKVIKKSYLLDTEKPI